MKPVLTSTRLLQSGFQQVGCWELNSARDLTHQIELPQTAGVYAFGIDGIVKYVGLASRSVRQRLGFYRKPGASQRTNVRLNVIMRDQIRTGATVQIFVAHPPDQEWNGFKIKGAEGLEADLICEFDLPWNVRGTTKPSFAARSSPAPQRRDKRQSDVAGKIEEAVRRRPGMTELEIAKTIYGPAAVQQQVNQDCRLLVGRGSIDRRGAGGRSDPYVYYPASGYSSESQ